MLPWSPHLPFPKQATFLDLEDARELFFGGAAGGGKSDVLLMDALRYAKVPGYSALILRRTFSDLNLPDAIMDRSRAWLAGSGARWNESTHTWTFSTTGRPSTITFGFLEHETDKFRYQGAQLQRVYFDELTQFTKTQYTYLLSRIRRPTWMPEIVKLGARSAANPGGEGHGWVMERFIEGARDENGQVWTDGCKVPLMASKWWRRDKEIIHDDGTVGHEDRYFIPSLLEDNPALDATYNEQLQELDPVTRAQLRRGDWTVKAIGNMFRPEWFKIVDSVPRGPNVRIRRHRYWDCAAGEVKPGANPDYTVGALVALVNGDWYIEDVERGRWRPKDLEDNVINTAELDGRRVEITMEQEPGASGVQVIDTFSRKLVGYTFRGEKKGYKKGSEDKKTQKQTKVDLAKPFSAAAERGRVHMVRASWNRYVIEEAMSFPGGAHDDIIDAIGGAMRQLASRVAPSWEGIPMGQPLTPSGAAALYPDPDAERSIFRRRM